MYRVVETHREPKMTIQDKMKFIDGVMDMMVRLNSPSLSSVKSFIPQGIRIFTQISLFATVISPMHLGEKRIDNKFNVYLLSSRIADYLPSLFNLFIHLQPLQ